MKIRLWACFFVIPALLGTPVAEARKLVSKPASEALIGLVPNRAGRVATGGFRENLKLYSKFAGGAERVERQEVERLLDRHRERVTGLAKLRTMILDAAEDRYVFAALTEYLEGGGKFHGMATGGHYRDIPLSEDPKPSLIIAIGLADHMKYKKGPVSESMFLPDYNIRATIIHELMHYILDKLDTAISEPHDMSAADHYLIDIIAARFTITDYARRGQLLKDAVTFDYEAWRKANPGADVLDAGFVETLVRPAMEALGRRNELAAEYNAQGLLRIIFTEQHLEEFAYLSSVNAVLVQQAAWLAESVKPKKPQDAFGDKKVRAVYQAFVERFLEHLDTARGDEALGRAHAIMQAVASPLLAAQK